MNDQSIKADGIVEALRAISTKNSISTYKRSVCKDAAALIERQAVQLAIMTAERDAAAKCIYDVETYLEFGSAHYIMKTIEAWKRGPQGAGEDGE